LLTLSREKQGNYLAQLCFALLNSAQGLMLQEFEKIMEQSRAKQSKAEQGA
jgi:hypothetical protein